MDTRGIIGFHIDGEREVVVYNHFDSYPRHLGRIVGEFIASSRSDMDEVRGRVRQMTPVEYDQKPTVEQVEALVSAGFADLDVGSRSTDDWYCLLRNTQSNPAAILAAGLYMPYNDFALDSLFCEWGYIMDFDREVVEVYAGFQKSAHTEGRFAKRGNPDGDRGYFPVRLIGEVAFDDPALADKIVALESYDDESEDAA